LLTGGFLSLPRLAFKAIAQDPIFLRTTLVCPLFLLSALLLCSLLLSPALIGLSLLLLPVHSALLALA
jgi:hypothetical protein